MSVPYVSYSSKIDTSLLNLTSRLAGKLNTSDTINMLSNYLRKSDALIIELQNQML